MLMAALVLLCVIEMKVIVFAPIGFWQPMDTLRDKMYLEQLWASDSPPWKVWE